MECWKFKAADKLKDYEAQRAAVQSLTEEIALLEAEACGIKSATADGTPVRGGGSGREDRLLNNIVKREERKVLLLRAKLAVRTVERGLAVLSTEDRRLLDVMYIHQEKGRKGQLMEEFGFMEESSLYKRVNKALLRFTVAMYGATEN